MTTATHTFPNGFVVQIDLEAIPDEARWLTLDPCGAASWRSRPIRSKVIPSRWVAEPAVVDDVPWRDVTGLVSIPSLPAWSECIIDLDAVRRQEYLADDEERESQRETQRLVESGAIDPDLSFEPDDGPPRLYDVVERQGHRGWVRSASGCHVKAEIAHHRMPLWHMDECTVIARNVYDIREAMRLMGEADA